MKHLRPSVRNEHERAVDIPIRGLHPGLVVGDARGRPTEFLLREGIHWKDGPNGDRDNLARAFSSASGHIDAIPLDWRRHVANSEYLAGPAGRLYAASAGISRGGD
jgi:hypothetical protein